MRNTKRYTAQPALTKGWFALCASAALLLSGCGGASEERDENDGVLINSVALPTDVVLNLACEDVGIWPENCVLGDAENPFATAVILEPDQVGPGEDDKFDLNDAIPPGPQGAKARFYLWATALARRGSGENQYYTARALHELFDANSNVLSTDEVVREQALKAYQSVLDNFFDSVTFFECDTCAPDEDGELIKFPAQLKLEVADDLYRFDSTGFRALIEGGDIRVLETFGLWGYTYLPATEDSGFTDGMVFKNE